MIPDIETSTREEREQYIRERFKCTSDCDSCGICTMHAKQKYTKVIPKYTYGDSRIDFYMESHDDSGSVIQHLMEVKGCTLERNGIGYFPDAPTERGIKHIRELIKAKKSGINASLAFVIQMDGVSEVRPNTETHPQFGVAMADAKKAGVEILFLKCHVEPDSLVII